MKTYRTLTSILTLGVMVSCGSDNSRDPATNDTAALTSVTLSTDPGTEPTTGNITMGDVTMGTPTSGMSASDGATGGSTSSSTSSSSEGRTTGDPGPVDCMCKIQPNGDGIGAQNKQPPPQAFEPVTEWEWTQPLIPNFNGGIEVMPLVANLTDDNGDGTVDLCDTPDVVVVVSDIGHDSHIYVLDGATGNMHFKTEAAVSSIATPALGDIDGDGILEIVSVTKDSRLIAFENDGTEKWHNVEDDFDLSLSAGMLGLADLDNDGDVEIYGGNKMWDHNGVLQWVLPPQNYTATAAADLDGDGDLEVILGSSAFHHNGDVYYQLPLTYYGAFPQVANLDNDPEPEVLLIDVSGISVLEHTGAVKYKNQHPPKEDQGNMTFPAAVADFDGDGISDFAVSRGDTYATYWADSTMIWKMPAIAKSIGGGPASTAFDFNGDGTFEAIYADDEHLFVFGNQGQILLQDSISAYKHMAYPVVADVDNDGSAEIVVVSGSYEGDKGSTVRVIGDKENRWPQARRIWNQHTYHVTNVNEGGTIPQFEQPSWKTHNTFRINSTLDAGGQQCEPPTPG
jgi:hypothetical protein